jgi:hypothetical protein
LRLREQIPLSWVGGPSHVTIKAVVEARAIVVIVMEELGIEWNSAPFSSWKIVIEHSQNIVC